MLFDVSPTHMAYAAAYDAASPLVVLRVRLACWYCYGLIAILHTPAPARRLAASYATRFLSVLLPTA